MMPCYVPTGIRGMPVCHERCSDLAAILADNCRILKYIISAYLSPIINDINDDNSSNPSVIVSPYSLIWQLVWHIITIYIYKTI